METNDFSIDEIFHRALNRTSIFKNRNVLRSDYIPDKLYFRDEQIKIVAETISPVLHGARPSNCLLYTSDAADE